MNYKKVLPLCLLVISSLMLPSAVYSQNIDSLYVAFINSEGSDFVKNANTITELLGDTANFTNKIPDNKIQARVVKNMIYYYYDLQRFRDVEELSFRAIKIYEELADSMNMAGCYHTLGIAYHHLGLFDRAIEYYYKCNDILAATGGDDSKRRSRYTLNNIGAIYLHIEDFDMAEKLYKQCISMINDKESEQRNMLDLSNYLNNLSEIYCKQAEKLDGNAEKAKTKEAVTTAEKALELSHQYGDEPVKITQRLVTLAAAYTANKEYAKAEKSLTEAQTIDKKNSLTHIQVEILASNAVLKNKTGNFNQSITLYDKAIKLAEQNEYNELLKHVAQGAYLANRTIAPASALRYYEIYISVKDSILNEESQKQINDFQVKYNIQEKELEIVRQQVEISRYKTLRFIYISGLTATGLLLAMLVIIVVQRTKRNRELAEMNATKNKLFTIISHDLKNPAIAQRNALQRLAENIHEFSPEIRSQFCTELLKSADHEVELIYSLLNWAQVQTGRMSYNPVIFNMVEALRSEIAIIQSMAGYKNIHFTVQTPDEVIVTGDKNMLTIVIRNLLTNAVKFTGKGGTVTLNIAPSSTGSIISVSDTGIGMNAEQIQNLFNMDKKQSKLGTAGEQGSGFGMIICRDMLQKHGSRLYIKSEEGQGSRFWFEIGS
jgi:signal transduction histidine kinase